MTTERNGLDSYEEENNAGGDTGTPTEIDDHLDDLGAGGSIADEIGYEEALNEDPLSDLHLPEDDMHVETIADLKREHDEGRQFGGFGNEEIDIDLDVSEVADVVAEARTRISVSELMARLVHQAEEVALRDLFVLSDLSRSDVEVVESAWSEVPVARRRRLLEWLVESSTERIELLFGRLLRIALRDEDETVRVLAINGLWEDTEADLIGPLTAILRSDTSEAARGAAASALGAFVLAGELDELDASLAMRAEQALLVAMQSAEEAIPVQARALESLAYSSEAGLRQMIEDAYYAPHDEMRLSAVRAMGRSADSRWRSMVRAELASNDTEMRAEAARAAGELELKAALPDLIALVEDDALLVRLAAIEALGHVGGKEARDLLRSIANDADVEEMQAAENALEEMLFFEEMEAMVGDDFGDDAGDDDEEEDDSDDDIWQRGARGASSKRGGMGA